MATYQKDRFDSVPDDLLRTGAHRGPARKGRGWIAFAWAALAAVVLIVAGIFGLSVITGKINLPFFHSAPETTATPKPTVTPTAEPKLDAAVPITVLNGSGTPGLADVVGDDLVKQGWGGAADGVGARAQVGGTEIIKATVVYYSDPANEAAARALVLSLKVGTIKLSDVYQDSPITIVVGSDYKAPTQ